MTNQSLKSISLCLVLMLILAGCAGVPIAPLAPEKKERTYQSDFNNTWRAVINVLNDRELPIATIEKESGLIVTDFVLVRIGFAEISPLFPMKPMDEPRAGRYKLSILVMPVGDQTKVKINAHFERYSVVFLEPSPTWKPQVSVGVLESEIFDAIQATLLHNPDQKK